MATLLWPVGGQATRGHMWNTTMWTPGVIEPQTVAEKGGLEVSCEGLVVELP
jgi:hypothetical protein